MAELTANAPTADRAQLAVFSHTALAGLSEKIQSVLRAAVTPAAPTDRVLIRGGIIELPSAGYLPIATGISVNVNDQVRALLGEGLDLRFCIVRPDYVAHALETAQHMERISLLQGLDNPDDKPKVDILVPDGHVVQGKTAPGAQLFDSSLTWSFQETGGAFYRGAGREEALSSGGWVLYSAGAGAKSGGDSEIRQLCATGACGPNAHL